MRGPWTATVMALAIVACGAPRTSADTREGDAPLTSEESPASTVGPGDPNGGFLPAPGGGGGGAGGIGAGAGGSLGAGGALAHGGTTSIDAGVVPQSEETLQPSQVSCPQDSPYLPAPEGTPDCGPGTLCDGDADCAAEPGAACQHATCAALGCLRGLCATGP